MPVTVDFFTLNELFLNSGAVSSPAELQGMLCGRLSGGAAAPEGWLAEAQRFLDIEDVPLDADQQAQIQALYQHTHNLLRDANFSFSPLLPGDESSIERRTAELGVWCQGFLHGFGSSGLAPGATLSAEVADALRDLAQISQVEVGDEDDLNENEVYWQELVEYVKVAVLTVYGECSDRSAAFQSQRVVH